ncbi:MAG: SIS domain-containing protein [Candidatus Omnitrophota bacterium]
MRNAIVAILKESIAVKEKLCTDALVETIGQLSELVITCLKQSGKVILFGNGGSAADSQHIAAEFIGRFGCERKALAAIALTCNSSNITAIANDYDFNQIFARQIEGLGRKNDLAIGITTSGNSVNVLLALKQAKAIGMKTAALSGENTTKLTGLADVLVAVPSKIPARIQEAHITIGHIICALAEQQLLR